jgi:hypothetical protein
VLATVLDKLTKNQLIDLVFHRAQVAHVKANKVPATDYDALCIIADWLEPIWKLRQDRVIYLFAYFNKVSGWHAKAAKAQVESK